MSGNPKTTVEAPNLGAASPHGTIQGKEGGAIQANQGGASQANQGGASQANLGGASQANQGGASQANQGGASQANQGGANQANQGGANQGITPQLTSPSANEGASGVNRDFQDLQPPSLDYTSNQETGITDEEDLTSDDSSTKKNAARRRDYSKGDYVKEKDARGIKKKKEVNMKYEEDLAKRTRLVVGRAPTLTRLAEELNARSHADVYLKIKYTSPSRSEPYVYSFGNNFFLPGELDNVNVNSPTPPPPSPVNPPTLEEAGHHSSQSSAQVISIPVEVSQQGLFDSPHSSQTRIARRPRNTSGPACFHCNGTEPYLLIGGVRVSAPFFYCAQEPCPGRVHNDCAGFPGIDYDDIKLFAPWYCSIHRGAGRGPMDVGVAEQIEPEQPAASYEPGRRSLRLTAKTAQAASSGKPAKASAGEKSASKAKGKSKDGKGAAGKAGKKT